MEMLQYIRTDRNGTKIFYDWKCPRCGGLGQADKWRYTGLVCFECGGTGKRRVAKVVKEYTPEYWAKLEARRIARQEKYEAEHAEEIAAAKAEQERREAEWKKRENARTCENHGCGLGGVGYVLQGNTYPIKDEIKANGGKWIFGVWVCPVEIKADGVTAKRVELKPNEYGIISGHDAGDTIFDAIEK